jgi:hypothetical protein
MRSRTPLALAVVIPVTAVLLTACSGSSDPNPDESTTGAAEAPQSAEVTPATTTPETTAAPETTDPTMIANNVIYWYGSGGDSQLNGVIRAAVDIREETRSQDGWVIDFGPFFDEVHDAQKYAPIPDRETQTAWKSALKHLNSGAGDVYDSTAFGRVETQSPKQQKQEARGWKEFDQGVKALKTVDSRVHGTFHVERPSTDPWDVSS